MEFHLLSEDVGSGRRGGEEHGFGLKRRPVLRVATPSSLKHFDQGEPACEGHTDTPLTSDEIAEVRSKTLHRDGWTRRAETAESGSVVQMTTEHVDRRHEDVGEEVRLQVQRLQETGQFRTTHSSTASRAEHGSSISRNSSSFTVSLPFPLEEHKSCECSCEAANSAMMLCGGTLGVPAVRKSHRHRARCTGPLGQGSVRARGVKRSSSSQSSTCCCGGHLAEALKSLASLSASEAALHPITKPLSPHLLKSSGCSAKPQVWSSRSLVAPRNRLTHCRTWVRRRFSVRQKHLIWSILRCDSLRFCFVCKRILTES